MSITPKQVKFNQESDKDILDYLEENDIVFGKYVRELIRKDMKNKSNSNDLEQEMDKVKQELKELRLEVEAIKSSNEEACTLEKDSEEKFYNFSDYNPNPEKKSNENDGVNDLIF